MGSSGRLATRHSSLDLTTPTTMAEPGPTPTTVTISTPHKSSPLKTVTRPVNPASRDEMAKHVFSHLTSRVSSEKMFELLGDGDKSGGDRLFSFPIHLPFRGKGRTAAICKYLNTISTFVKRKEATNVPWSIRFKEIPNNAPLEHPTLTQCRPDVAVFKQFSKQVDPTKLYWSQLEATGEDESTGKSQGEAHAQGASYTGYLLLARPDYISVPGIFFNATHFKLFLTNACQCYATDLIEWNSKPAQPLLYTWFWRLYHPEVDKSIEIHHESSGPPTFTVHTDGDTSYEGCSILNTGGPFGRRTTIFEVSRVVKKTQSQVPNVVDEKEPRPSNMVIKEQYIEVGRRYAEGPILEKIHKAGDFPGVVRVGWHGAANPEIKLEHREAGKASKAAKEIMRAKQRLVLLDKAAPLMGVHTPQEFLMALYDLLEITRILWREYMILHRDISSNNVLIRDKSEIESSVQPLSKQLSDMCFSEYLLQARLSPSSPHLPEQTEANPDLARLSTRVVLIDFDNSEDQTPVEVGKEQPKDRTGTPIFMARVVRANGIREGVHLFSPMPQLQDAKIAYSRAVGDRLRTFHPNEDDFIRVRDASPFSSFQHKLRYDAESVFWLFLWWSLQIKPEGKNESDTLIEFPIWNVLTSERDVRDANFICSFPKNILHPEYKPLEPLLQQMAEQLSGDHSLVPSRQHDEYLHEAFQRLILEFLFQNYDKSFMNLKTHDQFRKVDPDKGMTQGVTTRTSTKRSRDRLEEEDEARQPPKRRRPCHVPLRSQSVNRRKDDPSITIGHNS